MYVVLKNIQERMPRRAPYFYRNLCLIIHSAIDDDFENIHIPVQFFIMSQYEGFHPKSAVLRWVIGSLMEQDSTLKMSSIQRWV